MIWKLFKKSMSYWLHWFLVLIVPAFFFIAASSPFSIMEFAETICLNFLSIHTVLLSLAFVHIIKILMQHWILGYINNIYVKTNHNQTFVLPFKRIFFYFSLWSSSSRLFDWTIVDLFSFAVQIFLIPSFAYFINKPNKITLLVPLGSWKEFIQCTLFISSLSIYPSAHDELNERFSGNQW